MDGRKHACMHTVYSTHTHTHTYIHTIHTYIHARTIRSAYVLFFYSHTIVHTVDYLYGLLLEYPSMYVCTLNILHRTSVHTVFHLRYAITRYLSTYPSYPTYCVQYNTYVHTLLVYCTHTQQQQQQPGHIQQAR